MEIFTAAGGSVNQRKHVYQQLIDLVFYLNLARMIDVAHAVLIQYFATMGNLNVIFIQFHKYNISL